jgi:hypothetical protein
MDSHLHKLAILMAEVQSLIIQQKTVGQSTEGGSGCCSLSIQGCVKIMRITH